MTRILRTIGRLFRPFIAVAIGLGAVGVLILGALLAFTFDTANRGAR